MSDKHIVSQRRARSRGTSLVELLAATIFMGVSVAGIVSCVGKSFTNSEIARNHAYALFLATDVIESVRMEARMGNLSNSNTKTDRTDLVSGVTFSIEKDVKELTFYPAPKVFKVTSKVTWSSKDRKNEEIALETYIRDYDE